ncbi:alpha/beta hydrolase [Streptomyces sp. NPDC091266]|uniref:alpha/beta hydrolase n=1 Tax=Streptomyces sp. NPDC091266 TaxID=3365978 RepID=UPI003816DF6B
MNSAVRQRCAFLVSLAVLGTATLAACDGTPPWAPDRTSEAADTWDDPAARPSLRPFYGQQLHWKKCGSLQCATLHVPMDYRHPRNGKRFALPVVRHRAERKAQRIGSLVYNPGGPGASGVDDLKSGNIESFGARVRARFDVVTFDPRGVGGSQPAVNCDPVPVKAAAATRPTGVIRAVGPTAGPDSDGGDGDGELFPRTKAQRRAALDDARSETVGCTARSGTILRHVGTPDAARDVDVLRAALGERKLNFLGWSYGTSLGTTYGELFPRRVRTMVLDGAVDPANNWYRRAIGQGAAFQKSVEDYAQQCAKVVGADCPGSTPDEIRTLVDDLYATAADEPLPVADRDERLGVTELYSAITDAMYAPETQWQDLSAGLWDAADGDGTKLAELAQGEVGPAAASAGSGRAALRPGPRTGARAKDNSDAAMMAVNCLDIPHPRDPKAYWDALGPAYEKAGVYGTSSIVDELGCRNWPAGNTKPHPVRPVASGLPPALVVGTTGDPATPYGEARSLARQLPGGMLLTYEGLGHTAYGRSNSCVTRSVDAYLIDRTRIAPGTTC